MVVTIAHRGASGHALENTMSSFRKALELKADAIEFDVRATLDKKIVIMHDDDVSRTTTGKGLVSRLKFDELNKFSTLNGEKILRLEDALELLDGKCKIKIDIKSDGFEEKLIETLENYLTKNSIILTTELLSVIKRIREFEDRIPLEYGFTKKEPIEAMLAKVLQAKADIVSPYYAIASKELISNAHKAGLAVNVWTVNDIKVANRMTQMGVDFITTDFPEIVPKKAVFK